MLIAAFENEAKAINLHFLSEGATVGIKDYFCFSREERDTQKPWGYSKWRIRFGFNGHVLNGLWTGGRNEGHKGFNNPNRFSLGPIIATRRSAKVSEETLIIESINS